MCLKCNTKNYDPTMTTTLRNKFSSEAGGRWDKVKIALFAFITQKTITQNKVIDYDTSFLDDFEEVYDSNTQEYIIGGIILYYLLKTKWYSHYIDTVIDTSRTRTEASLLSQGIILQPTNLKSKELLHKSINQSILTHNSSAKQRLLAGMSQGLLANHSKKQLMEMVKLEINKNKNYLKTVVRTETVKAYNETILDVYESNGIDTVTSLVEWTTANNPCPICSSYKGQLFTLTEARGKLPQHMNCRCSWTSVNTNKN